MSVTGFYLHYGTKGAAFMDGTLDELYNKYDNYTNGYDYPEKNVPLNSGAIWFICFAPVFGLFLERYATSWIVGAVIWISCAVMMLTAELVDIRLVERSGYDASKLRAWVWLFPIYVMKRERLCRRDVTKAAMCGFFCIMAIVLNGFVKGISVDGDYLTVAVQSSGISSLDNFSGSSPKIIGDCVNSYMGEDTQWSYEKTDADSWIITAVGEHDGKTIDTEFVVVFDGYAYKGLSLTSITVDGEEQKDEDFSEMAKKIFID